MKSAGPSGSNLAQERMYGLFPFSESLKPHSQCRILSTLTCVSGSGPGCCTPWVSNPKGPGQCPLSALCFIPWHLFPGSHLLLWASSQNTNSDMFSHISGNGGSGFISTHIIPHIILWLWLPGFLWSPWRVMCLEVTNTGFKKGIFNYICSIVAQCFRVRDLCKIPRVLKCKCTHLTLAPSQSESTPMYPA